MVSHSLGLQGEKDDKIIAVCADDPDVRHYTDISELPPHRLAEIRRFFEDCILERYDLFASCRSSTLPIAHLTAPRQKEREQRSSR